TTTVPGALHDLRGGRQLPRLGPPGLTAARVQKRLGPHANIRGPPIRRFAQSLRAAQTKVQYRGLVLLSRRSTVRADSRRGDDLHRFAIGRQSCPAFLVSLAAAAVL